MSTMVQHRVGALIVMADPFLISRRRQLVELAARHAMPAIYAGRVFADVDGLMTYGASFRDLHRQAGIYVGKFSRAPGRLTSPSNRALKLNW